MTRTSGRIETGAILGIVGAAVTALLALGGYLWAIKDLTRRLDKIEPAVAAQAVESATVNNRLAALEESVRELRREAARRGHRP